jgi:starvation-inducible DNA-binding protein
MTASARVLASVLADTYILFLKTQNFEWNVRGSESRNLRQLFGEQSRALRISLSDIAERIRALDELAPATHAKLKTLAMVRETEELPDATAMLRELTVDNETLASTLRTALAAATAAGDAVTATLLTSRLAYQERQLWVMKSMLA